MAWRLNSKKPKKKDVEKDLNKDWEMAIQESKQFFLEEMREYNLLSFPSCNVDCNGIRASVSPGLDEDLCAISDGVKHGHKMSRIFNLSSFLNVLRDYNGLGHICANQFMRYLEIVSLQQDVIDASLLGLQDCCRRSYESSYNENGELVRKVVGRILEAEDVDFNFDVRIAEMTFEKIHLMMAENLSNGLASYLDIPYHRTSSVESIAKNPRVDSKKRHNMFLVNEMTWPEIMRMILLIHCLQELGETVDVNLTLSIIYDFVSCYLLQVCIIFQTDSNNRESRFHMF